MAGRLRNVVVHPLKEEVRRRHQIKQVHVYNNEGRVGIQLVTKSGLATLPIVAERQDRVWHAIKHFIPHIYPILAEQLDWSEDELRALLVERYLYGEAVEYEYKGTFSNVIV